MLEIKEGLLNSYTWFQVLMGGLILQVILQFVLLGDILIRLLPHIAIISSIQFIHYNGIWFIFGLYGGLLCRSNNEISQFIITLLCAEVIFFVSKLLNSIIYPYILLTNYTPFSELFLGSLFLTAIGAIFGLFINSKVTRTRKKIE